MSNNSSGGFAFKFPGAGGPNKPFGFSFPTGPTIGSVGNGAAIGGAAPGGAASSLGDLASLTPENRGNNFSMFGAGATAGAPNMMGGAGAGAATFGTMNNIVGSAPAGAQAHQIGSSINSMGMIGSQQNRMFGGMTASVFGNLASLEPEQSAAPPGGVALEKQEGPVQQASSISPGEVGQNLAGGPHQAEKNVNSAVVFEEPVTAFSGGEETREAIKHADREELEQDHAKKEASSSHQLGSSPSSLAARARSTLPPLDQYETGPASFHSPRDLKTSPRSKDDLSFKDNERLLTKQYSPERLEQLSMPRNTSGQALALRNRNAINGAEGGEDNFVVTVDPPSSSRSQSGSSSSASGSGTASSTSYNLKNAAPAASRGGSRRSAVHDDSPRTRADRRGGSRRRKHKHDSEERRFMKSLQKAIPGAEPTPLEREVLQLLETNSSTRTTFVGAGVGRTAPAVSTTTSGANLHPRAKKGQGKRTTKGATGGAHLQNKPIIASAEQGAAAVAPRTTSTPGPFRSVLGSSSNKGIMSTSSGTTSNKATPAKSIGRDYRDFLALDPKLNADILDQRTAKSSLLFSPETTPRGTTHTDDHDQGRKNSKSKKILKATTPHSSSSAANSTLEEEDAYEEDFDDDFEEEEEFFEEDDDELTPRDATNTRNAADAATVAASKEQNSLDDILSKFAHDEDFLDEEMNISQSAHHGQEDETAAQKAARERAVEKDREDSVFLDTSGRSMFAIGKSAPVQERRGGAGGTTARTSRTAAAKRTSPSTVKNARNPNRRATRAASTSSPTANGETSKDWLASPPPAHTAASTFAKPNLLLPWRAESPQISTNKEITRSVEKTRELLADWYSTNYLDERTGSPLSRAERQELRLASEKRELESEQRVRELQNKKFKRAPGQPSTYHGSHYHYYVVRNGSRGCMIQPGYPRIWPPSGMKKRQNNKRAASTSRSPPRGGRAGAGGGSAEDVESEQQEVLSSSNKKDEVLSYFDQTWLRHPQNPELRANIHSQENNDRGAPPSATSFASFVALDDPDSAAKEVSGRVILEATKIGSLDTDQIVTLNLNEKPEFDKTQILSGNNDKNNTSSKTNSETVTFEFYVHNILAETLSLSLLQDIGNFENVSDQAKLRAVNLTRKLGKDLVPDIGNSLITGKKVLGEAKYSVWELLNSTGNSTSFSGSTSPRTTTGSSADVGSSASSLSNGRGSSGGMGNKINMLNLGTPAGPGMNKSTPAARLAPTTSSSGPPQSTEDGPDPWVAEVIHRFSKALELKCKLFFLSDAQSMERARIAASRVVEPPPPGPFDPPRQLPKVCPADSPLRYGGQLLKEKVEAERKALEEAEQKRMEILLAKQQEKIEGSSTSQVGLAFTEDGSQQREEQDSESVPVGQTTPSRLKSPRSVRFADEVAQWEETAKRNQEDWAKVLNFPHCPGEAPLRIAGEIAAGRLEDSSLHSSLELGDLQGGGGPKKAGGAPAGVVNKGSSSSLDHHLSPSTVYAKRHDREKSAGAAGGTSLQHRGSRSPPLSPRSERRKQANSPSTRPPWCHAPGHARRGSMEKHAGELRNKVPTPRSRSGTPPPPKPERKLSIARVSGAHILPPGTFEEKEICLGTSGAVITHFSSVFDISPPVSADVVMVQQDPPVIRSESSRVNTPRVGLVGGAGADGAARVEVSSSKNQELRDEREKSNVFESDQEDMQDDQTTTVAGAVPTTTGLFEDESRDFTTTTAPAADQKLLNLNLDKVLVQRVDEDGKEMLSQSSSSRQRADENFDVFGTRQQDHSSTIGEQGPRPPRDSLQDLLDFDRNSSVTAPFFHANESSRRGSRDSANVFGELEQLQNVDRINPEGLLSHESTPRPFDEKEEQSGLGLSSSSRSSDQMNIHRPEQELHKKKSSSLLGDLPPLGGAGRKTNLLGDLPPLPGLGGAGTTTTAAAFLEDDEEQEQGDSLLLGRAGQAQAHEEQGRRTRPAKSATAEQKNKKSKKKEKDAIDRMLFGEFSEGGNSSKSSNSIAFPEISFGDEENDNDLNNNPVLRSSLTTSPVASNNKPPGNKNRPPGGTMDAIFGRGEGGGNEEDGADRSTPLSSSERASSTPTSSGMLNKKNQLPLVPPAGTAVTSRESGEQDLLLRAKNNVPQLDLAARGRGGPLRTDVLDGSEDKMIPSTARSRASNSQVVSEDLEIAADGSEGASRNDEARPAAEGRSPSRATYSNEDFASATATQQSQSSVRSGDENLPSGSVIPTPRSSNSNTEKSSNTNTTPKSSARSSNSRKKPSSAADDIRAAIGMSSKNYNDSTSQVPAQQQRSSGGTSGSKTSSPSSPPRSARSAEQPGAGAVPSDGNKSSVKSNTSGPSSSRTSRNNDKPLYDLAPRGPPLSVTQQQVLETTSINEDQINQTQKNSVVEMKAQKEERPWWMGEDSEEEREDAMTKNKEKPQHNPESEVEEDISEDFGSDDGMDLFK
ncbi:unnamed protein product [Amoebophrya sp. A120]|nr:unnamed protein product [Amoebophrya sp. A120]|eukprot:GSA120T00007618001.1